MLEPKGLQLWPGTTNMVKINTHINIMVNLFQI